MRNIAYALLAYIIIFGNNSTPDKSIDVEVNPLQSAVVATSEPIEPLVADKPVEHEPMAYQEPEEDVYPPRDDLASNVYSYNETINQINNHKESGGNIAITNPPSYLFRHVQEHDLEDGFRNYPVSVLQELTYEQLQWLHGLMHKIEDTQQARENAPCKVVKSNNRIIYVGADWCGPCKTFKNTGALKELEESGWDISNEKEADLQVIDTDKDAEEYRRIFPNGVNGIPAIFIMKDGRIISKRHPTNLLTNNRLGEKFTEWVKREGNIYKW